MINDDHVDGWMVMTTMMMLCDDDVVIVGSSSEVLVNFVVEERVQSCCNGDCIFK